MTDRDLTAVLERAVDALSPRDPDPVGAVLRRVRAWRRRVIATGAAAAVALGSLGAAGALALGGDDAARTIPAGPVRHVEPWSGEAVTLRGVHVPVPDGWRVEDAAPTPDGYPCRGTATDHTVFVVRRGAGWMPCERVHGSFVVLAVVPQVFPDGIAGMASLALDPSGQPVWTGADDLGPTIPAGKRRLRFVFAGVEVTALGFGPADAEAYLSQVSAGPAAPAGQVVVASDARSAHYVDYDSNDASRPRGVQGWSRSIPDDVEDLLSPASMLRCLPAPGTITVANLDRGSDAPDGSNGEPPTVLTFDRTGACDQAFDGRGGLAQVDGAALHALLRSYDRTAGGRYRIGTVRLTPQRPG
jgi:hypothetical protein